MTDPYTRLYHKFAGEFPAVYSDDRQLASWIRLLMVADASWPMRPPIPRSVPVRVWNRLVDAGLVLPDGDTYTVRGLDAERSRRRDAGRTGAVVRWQNERNGNASADAMLRRDETSTRRDIPPPPAERGRRKDGTNPRATGAAPRQLGDSPRQNGHSPRQERERIKRDPTPIHVILARANANGGDA